MEEVALFYKRRKEGVSRRTERKGSSLDESGAARMRRSEAE